MREKYVGEDLIVVVTGALATVSTTADKALVCILFSMQHDSS